MAKSKKKDLEATIKYLERGKFLDKYTEFDKWLLELKFRQGHYWKESSTSSDYKYAHYDEYVNALYGVEHYINDILNLSIRFLRDRHDHKFMVVGALGSFSEVYTLDEFKVLILKQVKELKEIKLKELESINI